MATFINLVKPVLFSFLTSKAVKELVIDLLKKYVRTTDNQIDDTVVLLVEQKLFTAQ